MNTESKLPNRPLLAGGRTREQAEDDAEDGAMDWLADALEAIRESGDFSLFTSDEDGD